MATSLQGREPGIRGASLLGDVTKQHSEDRD
jgi:hypothetical protein